MIKRLEIGIEKNAETNKNQIKFLVYDYNE